MSNSQWFLPSLQQQTKCFVRPLIGGDEAMADMRTTLKTAIEEARTLPLDSQGFKGYVYLAAWRFDAARDLTPSDGQKINDGEFGESAVSWLLYLMRAQIAVRVRLWLPSRFAAATSFARHAENHLYVARVIEAYNNKHSSGIAPLGICLLDRRLPGFSASHHHKTLVVRVGRMNVGYCGGIDFAFTRRNMPSPPGGDPQSGSALRSVAPLNLLGVAYPRQLTFSDLPENIYGTDHQHWHDQHVRLEGGAVEDLERIFCERWIDVSRRPPAVLDCIAKRGFARFGNIGTPWHAADLIVSTAAALTPGGNALAALPEVVPIDERVSASGDVAGEKASVQFWQTVPVQSDFSVLSGVLNAVDTASESIWIFDQYFWSVELAERLNSALYRNPHLHVVVVVPPYADAFFSASHAARRRAYDALVRFDPQQTKANPNGIRDRIGFYAMWHPEQQRGIYQHAKVHMYDAQLLLIGSANCNARSYYNDTEVVAAIQSRRVIYAHMHRLWKSVFPHTQWPWALIAGKEYSLPIETAGWGRIFFEAFTDAASRTNSTLQSSLNNLIPDPVCLRTPLPNRTMPRASTVLYRLLSRVIDPRA